MGLYSNAIPPLLYSVKLLMLFDDVGLHKYVYNTTQDIVYVYH